jgi:hypothetical protein
MAAVMNEVRKMQRKGSQLDPELKPTDDLATLWARVTREGTPLSSNAIARAIAEAEGAALPGGEEWLSDSVLAFDNALAKAPQRVKLFVQVWYKQPGTSDTRASRLGISRAALYYEWKSTLWFLRGMLLSRNVGV